MDEDDEAKEAARLLPPRLHFTITTILDTHMSKICFTTFDITT